MFHKKFLLLVSLLLSFGFSCALPAQTVAPTDRRHELFGGYSFLSNSFNGHDSATSHQPLNGWDAAFTAGVSGRLGVKVDASGYYGTSLGSPQHPIFVMGGLQYSMPVGRGSVFMEGLVGFGHLNKNYWLADEGQATSSFTAVAGGGLDFPITPRVAWRIEGDLQHSNFTVLNDEIHGLPNYFARILTGPVWRF